MQQTEKKAVNYEFTQKHNRFEINVQSELALPILVLNQPMYDQDGTITKKGVLLIGDYIVDDFVATHPSVKDEWFIVSTTQSHLIPKSVHPDLHLYNTQDGNPSPEYRDGPSGHIPDLLLVCGHYVDADQFYPDKEIEKDFDLLYVSKWAPTKRIEHVLDAAKADPTLRIAILGFPVVSERKRAASDAYRELIITRIIEEKIENVTIIEHDEESHLNEDGTFVVGGFSKDEIRMFLNRAHTSILSADANEGINRSLAEALCCDLPIMLTADTLGGAQTLVQEETGLRVQPNGEAIAAATRFIIDNRDQFSPREWFVSKFGREKANQILKQKIEEIAEMHGLDIHTDGLREYLGDPWGFDYYSTSLYKKEEKEADENI